MKNNWFAAYAVNLLDKADEIGNEHLLAAEENLTLITASQPEEAQKKATELGLELAEFSRALIESDSDYLERKGLGALLPVIEYKDKVLSGDITTSHLGDHFRKYKTFEFAGIARLVTVGPSLKHGTVIDCISRNMTVEAAQRSLPPKVDLSAFSPAGPAYSGAEREAQNRKLYEEFKWYLAEQIFRGDDSGPAIGAKTIRVRERLVILHGNEPEEAFRRALDDAASYEDHVRLESGHSHAEAQTFLGLHELSLIESDLGDDLCEIRSQRLSLTKRDLTEYFALMKCPES
jgi:hypothetical protein